MALKHQDYTIGWIATSGVELATATALLNATHPRLPQLPGDDVAYTLGRVGNHNVVIAGLRSGSRGATSVIDIATNMVRSFLNIKLVLMVGVAGGVSNADVSPMKDVRLGDIFISIPEGSNGGVCQYDFGTALQNGFKRKGVLNKPPKAVRYALADLQSNAEMKGYRFQGYYQEMLKKHPSMTKEYARPAQDNLYRADYSPQHNRNNCSGCDSAMLVRRRARNIASPVVHYGTIGSGNQDVRNAVLRDKLYREEGIKCLEMHAAGLMDTVDCLIICGISDYCDSHKNNEWQAYAGAMASAFAKELLTSM